MEIHNRKHLLKKGMTKILFALCSITTLFFCKNPKTNANYNIGNQDSIIYLNNALNFIKQITPQETQDSSFILVNRPFRFEYYGCLDDLLNDKITLTRSE